mmetsp:Transcript_26062/g.42052  ORF Transcript_26062/g.42052 Transcript_26062/m.42052 type:complete len:770 (-) Transcript_26062:4218-6527(-)
MGLEAVGECVAVDFGGDYGEECDDLLTAVRVAVRVRPLLGEEEARGCEDCVSVVENRQIVLGKNRSFTYDVIYDQYCSQRDLFHHSVSDLVEGCLEGYNATVLAYGQTGSGKTYTMGMSAGAARLAKARVSAQGLDEEHLPDMLGLVPRVCSLLFKRIRERGDDDYKVYVTYLEIYNEQVCDLLRKGPGKAKLAIRDNAHSGVAVDGIHQVAVSSVDEILEQVEVGASVRTTGSTQMNAKSSRSHAILTIVVEQEDRVFGTSRVAKFHLVDLAGSERNKRTGAVGERFQESIQINQGLLALGNVISILGDESNASSKVYVPYRQSKLTRLLRDSLGGNSRTLFIACVSPADESHGETLNSLKYANRARNIKNMPILNNVVQVQPPKPTEREEEEEEEEVERGEFLRQLDWVIKNGPQKLLETIQTKIGQVLDSKQVEECTNPRCAEKIKGLAQDLKNTQADLERDEIIFASRVQEIKETRKQLEFVHEDREQMRIRLIELEEENRNLLADECRPSSYCKSSELLLESPVRVDDVEILALKAAVQEKEKQLSDANEKLAQLQRLDIPSLEERISQLCAELETVKSELVEFQTSENQSARSFEQIDEWFRKQLSECLCEWKKTARPEQEIERQQTALVDILKERIVVDNFSVVEFQSLCNSIFVRLAELEQAHREEEIPMKKRLDQEYISSLEKDIRYYKKMIEGFKKKAKKGASVSHRVKKPAELLETSFFGALISASYPCKVARGAIIGSEFKHDYRSIAARTAFAVYE